MPDRYGNGQHQTAVATSSPSQLIAEAPHHGPPGGEAQYDGQHRHGGRPVGDDRETELAGASRRRFGRCPQRCRAPSYVRRGRRRRCAKRTTTAPRQRGEG